MQPDFASVALDPVFAVNFVALTVSLVNLFAVKAVVRLFVGFTTSQAKPCKLALFQFSSQPTLLGSQPGVPAENVVTNSSFFSTGGFPIDFVAWILGDVALHQSHRAVFDERYLERLLWVVFLFVRLLDFFQSLEEQFHIVAQTFVCTFVCVVLVCGGRGLLWLAPLCVIRY